MMRMPSVVDPMTDDFDNIVDQWEPTDQTRVPQRLLGWRAVHRAVGFTQSHVYNLEAAVFFPRRLKLTGQRIAWLENEILAWMQARVDARGSSVRLRVESGDRFIFRREVKEMVPYSIDHLGKLEKKGMFPRRIQVGPKRVGWL